MVMQLEKARQRARRAVESLYEGRCTVLEYGKTKDPTTQIIKQCEVIVLEDQPCRLSFSSSPAAAQGDAAAQIAQSIVLFLAPEPIVRPGSKIVVTQAGRVGAYKASGPPKVYPTHQEIALELYEERA